MHCKKRNSAYLCRIVHELNKVHVASGGNLVKQRFVTTTAAQGR